jgi:hypothetical protein
MGGDLELEPCPPWVGAAFSLTLPVDPARVALAERNEVA